MARYVQGPEGVQVIQDDPRYMLPPGVQQINTNQNVPGGAFQNLLNQLTGGINANRQLLGKAARYAPGAGRTIEELQQGDILGTLGSVGGMYAAGQAAKTLGAKIPAYGLPGMRAKGALYADGSLPGSNLGAGVAGGVGKAAQAAVSGVGDLISGGQGRQRERGESPTATGLGTGKGVGDLDADAITDLAKRMGMSQVEVYQALIDPYRQKTAVDVQNQMQLNQQLAQLTGGLNQQRYTAQLAGGALQQAGATTRTMMTSPNPYADSVFKYS